jgi:lipoprotein-anchoring transpeptidase ErfK/SrfK
MAVHRVRKMLGSLAVLGALAVLAACTSPSSPSSTFNTPAPPPATLVFNHDADAKDVSPGDPVVVQVQDGTLETVSLTSNLGEVKGALSPDRSTWQSTDDLDYGKTYTIKVSSMGADGKPVEETRTFSTVSVKTGYYWDVSFVASKYYGVVLNGGTFGVGQPIVAQFTDTVDKAIAESTLKVTTVPAVEGSWHWINSREAHWRPKEYWQPGTKVTVEAKILGVSLVSPSGKRTLWGHFNKTATFTIGQSKIAKVDNTTHQMKVYIDGKLTRTIPVSMGREGLSPPDSNGVRHNWNTTSGTFVVTEKKNPVIMTPAGLDPIKDGPKGTGLYYEDTVYYAVRITDYGEYVHSAPWSEGSQGHTNVSHGCVNINHIDAPWFYKTFGPGDVVQISHTKASVDVNAVGKERALDDGLADWSMSWNDWVKGSALPHTAPTTPAPTVSATPSATASA